MKLYVISGLGADKKVFEKIQFPKHLEVVFIDWLIPQPNEEFQHYIDRIISENINTQKDFCLLGYSLGGMIVQEIHKKFPAKKVIILASIKSELGKSQLMKIGMKSGVYKLLSLSLFNEKSYSFYAFVRYIFDTKNPNILKYFNIRHPYYLKWCIEKALEWKTEENPEIIQVLGDKDIVFPIKNSKPNYVLKGATHLFPVTKAKEVSEILKKEFNFT